MPAIVLVADTDSTSLELVSAVLTREGFVVLATPDGGDALARFFEASPTVVVCARELPGLSGDELCRQIKAQQSDAKVVLFGDAIDAAHLTSTVGCDAVLARPFSYPKLKGLLVEWGVIEGSATAGPSQPAAAFGVPAPQPFNFEAPAAVAPPSFDALQPVAPPVPESVVPPAAAAPAAAPAPASALSVPPLSVPIPLPMPQQAPAIDPDIPDFDMDSLSHPPEPAAPEEDLAPGAEMLAGGWDGTTENAPAAAPLGALEPAEEELPELAVEAVVSSAALNVPLEGDLTQTPLPRLVYELYIATFSGVLHLKRSGVDRGVYLRGGIPVRVDSHQMSEMLGRVLVDHGRITMEQYTQSLQVMQEQSLRQGEALIAIGALRQSELLEALREQTELKLANSMAWRDGTYRIDSDASFEDNSVISEVSALKAIWRGVHEHYDLESLLAYFTPLQGRYIVAGDLFAVHYDTLGPFVRDLKLTAILDGKSTFEQALNQGERTLRVAQAIYVLMVTDMVAASDAPGAAVVEPTPGAASATPAGARPAAAPAAPQLDPAAVQRLADEIAAEYLRFKDSDYFDLLRLDPSCSADEVDFAYQNVMRSLHLDELPPDLPSDATARAAEIRAILTKARAVLRDPTARDNYLRGQQDQFTSLAGSMHDQMAMAQSDPGPPMPGAIQSLEVDLTGERHNSILAQQAYMDGQGFMRSQLWEEAAGKFQEAIAAGPREPSYRVALGRAIAEAEGTRDENARRKIATCLQQALQLDPTNEEGNLEMAKLLVLSGHKDRAYPYLQRVLQRSPSHPEARKLLAELG